VAPEVLVGSPLEGESHVQRCVGAESPCCWWDGCTLTTRGGGPRRRDGFGDRLLRDGGCYVASWSKYTEHGASSL
jgi:hypothetical protein